MPADFGAKLAFVRERQGFTQADLTRRLGVRRAHISNLEAGRRAPSLDFAVRTAELLAVSLDYLLRAEIPVEAPDRVVRQSSQLSKSIGAQIRALRLQRGLRQAELAASLGLQTQAHISLIESGQKEPSLQLLLKIADYFGVLLEELVFGEVDDQEAGS